MAPSSMDNPFDPVVARQGLVILDGGLATELEERGYDLRDPLWSAKLLVEAPDAIAELHYDYLRAGADCITTATYQASLAGFRNRGLADDEGIELMRLAVRLATDARDRFWSNESNRAGREFPIVAASIGPYGAYLADGSEYTGDYDTTDAQLADFHRERWRVLAASEADLLACETIPSGAESAVLLRLLDETPGSRAWMSFSCRDGRHLCDGTPLGDVVERCHEHDGVIAVGINCTAPQYIPSLITEARSRTDRMLIVYPNLGERYDAVAKTWGPGPSTAEWLKLANDWPRLGVAGIGGCCRIGPNLIGRLRRRIVDVTGR